MAKNLNAGMQCVKYMLFTTNFMFVMIGFLLVCIGGIIRGLYGEFEIFMQDRYFSPANITVAVGAIIFMVALLGCVGAIKESTCLINIYALCLALVLILELSAAIAALTMKNDIKYTVRTKMETSMKDYTKPDQYTKDVWDYVQERLYCCGVDSFTEWQRVVNVTKIEKTCTKDSFVVPDSCCHDYYTRGCFRELAYILSESSVLLGVGALCVAFVQFMGVIFARILANTVRSLKTQMLVERQQRREELYNALHGANVLHNSGSEKHIDSPENKENGSP